MKIELKRINVDIKFSEETVMFTADVYIEGEKVAYAKNDGRGAMTYYHMYEQKSERLQKRNRELLKQAELYCKNMPNRFLKYDYKGETRTIELEYSLQYVINELVNKYLYKIHK
jgi:hypothetical protein